MEEKKEDCINPENFNQNIDNLPEPEITENEMKEIIDFINNWDYEKYERDSEVREALLLLRSKMKKEEEEKAQQLEELRIKEKNAIINNNIKEENKNDNIYIEDQSKNNNKVNIELSEQEKEILEKNWNSSTKPEYGEKIVNEKGDKEIIINNDKKIKKVIIIFNIFYVFNNRKIILNIKLLMILFIKNLYLYLVLVSIYFIL